MSESTEIMRQKMQLPQSAGQIKDQVIAIQSVMREVMKADVHYGIIPGTKKPTLYKAGAEVLLSTFRISVRPEIVDLSSEDEIRYRVQATGVHMSTDTLVSIGVGEASTNEEKYKWREAANLEFEKTPEARRRVKYGWKWGQGQGQKIDTETKQVRTNPADLANTVLKMAKKRAQIDLCLTALAASDVFSQDIEDGPQTMGAQTVNPKAQSTAPERTTNQGNFMYLTVKQLGLVRRKLDDGGISAEALCEQYGIEDLEKLKFSDVNAALDWIKEQTK